MSRPTLESAEVRRQFRVLARLGAGGYGTVYLAELMGAGGFLRQVAIKVAHQSPLDTRAGARLLDEARMLGLVRHKAIVAVEGLISLDGNPAMIMEYIEGVSLAALAEQGPVPPRVTLQIGSELAAALHAAWTAKGSSGKALELVHRDIKPANIMLTARGEVKLLDFGIARAQLIGRHAQTTVGAVPGSADYLAPERTETGGYGPAADIYALGAVLYELMRGEPLAQLRGNVRQFERTLSGRLDLLAARIGRESPVLTLVENMLAWRPESRPTALEVRRDCDRLFDVVQGERLLDWAEVHVPTLLSEVTATGDDRTGRIYAEESFSLESITPGGASRPGREAAESGETASHPVAAPRAAQPQVAAPRATEIEVPTEPRIQASEEATDAQVLSPAPPVDERAAARATQVEPESAVAPPPDANVSASSPVQSGVPQVGADAPRPIRRVLRWIGGITAIVAAITTLVTQVDTLRNALRGEAQAPVQQPPEVVPPGPVPVEVPVVPHNVEAHTEPEKPSEQEKPSEPEVVPVPTVSPPPPEVRPATATLIGDATSFWLTKGRTQTSLTVGAAATLKPGTWQMFARFEDTGTATYPLGKVEVREGDTLTFTCRSDEHSCARSR